MQTHHLAIERNIELAAVAGATFPCFKMGGTPRDSSPPLAPRIASPQRRPPCSAPTRARLPVQSGLSTKKMMSQLRDRFKLYKSSRKLRRWVVREIEYAYDSFWTNSYAKFQLLTNGIMP